MLIEKYTNIANAIKSVESLHVVTTAEQIYDETLGEYQDVLNRRIAQGLSTGDSLGILVKDSEGMTDVKESTSSSYAAATEEDIIDILKGN